MIKVRLIVFVLVISIFNLKCSNNQDNEIIVDLKKSTLSEYDLDKAVSYAGSRLIENLPNGPVNQDSSHYFYAKCTWKEVQDTVVILLNSKSDFISGNQVYIKNNSFKYVQNFRFNSIDIISNSRRLSYSTDIMINNKKRKLDLTLFPERKFYIYHFEDLRIGNLIVDSKSYNIALIMETGNWDYDDTYSKNILIDLNSDNIFTLSSEVDSTGNLFPNENFKADNPFPVNGKHYKISKIENDGTKLLFEEVIGDTLPFMGFQAPDFSLRSIEGDTLRIHRDKITVLHFWAISCPPCEIVRPELNDLYDNYANDKNISFCSIALDKEEDISEFIKSHSIHYKIAAINDIVKAAYNVTIYPRDIIIDKNGTIIFDETGGVKGRGYVLDKVIQNAL